MTFQGSGSGFITYQIQNEQPVNAKNCKVQVIEDDGAGSLMLNISFNDAVHGQVQAGISVFGYQPGTHEYTNVASLLIGFNTQQPLGGWSSGAGSSVMLDITQQASQSARTYSGSFDAANLIWQNSGNQDALAIKFATFTLTAQQTGLAAAGLTYQNGAGAGSVTYKIGDSNSDTQAASATTTSYYNNGVLYSVILNLAWTDRVQGKVVVMLICNPFTKTGTYRSSNPNQELTMMFSTQVAGNGNWGNSNFSSPVITLDVIYNPSVNGAQWDGTLNGDGLVWQGQGSQPDLNVKLLALTFTITND
jgi:hypothetical protein